MLTGFLGVLGLLFATLSAPSQTQGSEPRKALVLYDSSGAWGHLGELYAQMVGNLTTHFGEFEAMPVTDYEAGRMAAHSGVVYIGSSHGEPLPQAFLDDVLADTTRVLWLGDNLPQLHDRAAVDAIPGFFVHQYGWQYRAFDNRPVSSVTYKGRSLDRDTTHNIGSVMDLIVEPSGKATVVAQGNRSDGTSFPWAIRSGHLTYVGEVPLTHIDESDRYLILGDLLFDLLDPGAQERHRAMVRIEDVSPMADPAHLRAIADLLHGRGIAFSVGVIPVFVDPGQAKRVTLAERPDVVAALKYMVEHGATLIQHGYTHQFGTHPNPYNGVTGEDFEFFAAYVDQGTDDVIMTGPVAGDSEPWALQRMQAGGEAMLAAGLPVPGVFEFPHYAASTPDYAAATHYAARYERGLYFAGYTGTGPDHARFAGQFFPYEVTDVYGSRIIPENLGNVRLTTSNNHPPILPTEIIDRAAKNLVVRDGYASFFFHAFLDPALLAETVDGITALGYDFVSPGEVLAQFPGNPVRLPLAPLDVRVRTSGDSVQVQVITDPIETVRPQAFRYTLDDGAWAEVAASPDQTFTLTGLSATTHRLTVAAVNVVGTGPSLGPVSFSLAPTTTAPPPVPATLQRPAGLRVKATRKALKAKWRSVAGAERYRVRVAIRSGRSKHSSVQATNARFTGRFAKGSRVRLCVWAVNPVSTSGPTCVTKRVR